MSLASCLAVDCALRAVHPDDAIQSSSVWCSLQNLPSCTIVFFMSR